MLTAALFIVAKIGKQPKCPSIKQLWDSYMMEFYSAIKKKEILPLVTVWMDLENIFVNDIRQSEKDKCYMILLMWSLMNKLN